MTGADVDRQLERFQEACREAGVKVTHQRLEIFREVAGRADHPDAEGVFRAVRERLPTVSLDTVYRTLTLLGDLGLVGTLGPRRESVRFDPNLHPHHHFVCTRCGLVRDFEGAGLADLKLPEAVKAMGAVETLHLELRGVCTSCARAAKRGRTPAH